MPVSIFNARQCFCGVGAARFSAFVEGDTKTPLGVYDNVRRFALASFIYNFISKEIE